MALPWLLPSVVLSRVSKTHSIQTVMLAWGISAFMGVVLLIAPFVHAMRVEGRAHFPGRPGRGLAGKPWGPLAPSITARIGLLVTPVAIFIGYRAGLHPIGLAFVAALGASILVAYVRSMHGLRMQRERLIARPDAEGDRAVPRGQALSMVSRVMRVPPEKLYATDRFGQEVGTLHPFDETLDRLGGRLVLLKKECGRDLSIERLQTVGEFIEEWNSCSTRSKASKAI